MFIQLLVQQASCTLYMYVHLTSEHLMGLGLCDKLESKLERGTMYLRTYVPLENTFEDITACV